MYRQIAVLMSAINISNQKKILEGMIDAAKETDSNLFVFTCHINYNEKEENKQGAYQIMKLPDFRYFDGAVIVRNTIQHEPTAKQVFAALKESGIPAVSIDSEILGMDCIGISNYEAQYQLVEHLINEHGCRDICYIAGPSFNEEANERKRAYQDALQAGELPYRAENIGEGLWDEISGGEVMESLLAQRGCPDAVVCANDMMAMGAMEVLKQHGYRIPQDVCVVGFDNEELSALFNPPLTSVDKNQHDIGREAILALFDEKIQRDSRRILVPTHPMFRGSCGCGQVKEVDDGWICDQYVKGRLRTHKVADNLKNMLSDFSGMRHPSELIESLKSYVVQTDMENFYLCLCDEERLFGTSGENLSGELDLEDINTDYTDDMTIPLAYEDGKFGVYGAFPKGQVLPEVCRNKSGGNFYVVVPIYYQRFCYGYSISSNSRFPLEDGLYYSWLMSIGIGLENIRKWMLLKDTVVRLNQMWVYDMLTHLYNRAGFFHFAEPMLTKMKGCGEEAFLLFLDIDGLKTVNDTLGHEMGDLLISSMAEIIKRNVGENELAMRYGGDEFVIFGSLMPEGRMEELMQTIRCEMDAWNNSNKDFKMSASVGSSRFLAEEIGNLSERIEQADKRMYEEKRLKKGR